MITCFKSWRRQRLLCWFCCFERRGCNVVDWALSSLQSEVAWGFLWYYCEKHRRSANPRWFLVMFSLHGARCCTCCNKLRWFFESHACVMLYVPFFHKINYQTRWNASDRSTSASKRIMVCFYATVGLYYKWLGSLSLLCSDCCRENFLTNVKCFHAYGLVWS